MEHYIYLGTYTQKGSQGIYGMTVSPEGKLISGPELVAEQPSPTYFYLSHDHKMLYTVSEPERKGTDLRLQD